MSLKKNIAGLTLGIKYDKNFRIPDVAGSMVEDILRDKNSPFSVKDMFPRIQESPREKILYNPKTTDYLRFNTDDIILGFSIKDNFEKTYKWLVGSVIKYYKDNLFKTYGIKNFRRVGIIFHHKIPHAHEFPSKIVKEITDNKISNAEDIFISFSKKLQSTEARYRKGVNDYKNTIYNIGNTEDALLADLDYQFYYEPGIEDLRNAFVERICADAESFLENFYSWLSKYETKRN